MSNINSLINKEKYGDLWVFVQTLYNQKIKNSGYTNTHTTLTYSFSHKYLKI